MKQKILLPLVSFCFLQGAFLPALLPPLYTGIQEIKAILTDPHLPDHLQSGEVILSIEKQEGGYLITTNKQQLVAEIHPEAQTMPGPEQFTVHFRP